MKTQTALLIQQTLLVHNKPKVNIILTSGDEFRGFTINRYGEGVLEGTTEGNRTLIIITHNILWMEVLDV